MHELSIAEAILDLARRNVPLGGTLRSVRITAGPMRGIDPQCMQMAWQAIGQGDVALNLSELPWRMQCADCGRRWEQPELAERCACGSPQVRPVGGDELQLVSIEVDDAEEERSSSCTCKLSKTS
ncbi:MAG: hydrogenase maturation nickel metallochaperone HypA [Tepidisphaeraceae bacterium]|jgi:Zn finger protein HypA/HybF involved in hydrogenase expression